MGQYTALELGLDIGSTTVKAVAITPDNQIVYKEYRRHNSHQPETLRAILAEIQDRFPECAFRISITGSGGRSLAAAVSAQFIQEVNAVTLAVEMLHPDAGSVIELGGQDAKVIIWKGENGKKSTLTYMNDKCAGGTGSTIDKIMSKVGFTPEEASQIRPEGQQIHQIAAKCGVFAETDVVGLLKAGIQRSEIFISLCHAIVKQNLEVLVKGNILPEKVLLLGGPNTFIPAFAPIWRQHIADTWQLHGYTPHASDLTQSIIIPEDAHFFAAIGTVFFSRTSAVEHHIEPKTLDFGPLDAYISGGRTAFLESSTTVLPPLAESDEERQAFARDYAIPSFANATFEPHSTVRAFLGVDGGSTSTKMVLLDSHGSLIYKDYLLSKGNPIEDMQLIFGRLKTWRDSQKIRLDIVGTGATGYAQEILKSGFNFDVTVVETVAHMRSAVQLYGNIDVICDVGGQDIKVLFLKHGRVVDFKLNTQCSAGNGYFLQGMAEQFRIPVEEYADHAFSAIQAPKFNYGCAVFMEQDRVNFQQAGWTKEEMMSGLAQVLPLNIWNYVVQESNLAKLGKRFVLQGGTQKNLAAAKAQVDFIKDKVPGAEVHIHKYADIGGAIGAALEVMESLSTDTPSQFIGIDEASGVTFTSVNNESTVCGFCQNKCKRTFITITHGSTDVRFITGYQCEKGQSDTVEDMKAQSAAVASIKKETKNLVDLAAHRAFSHFSFEPIPEKDAPIAKKMFYPKGALPFLQQNSKKFVRSSATAQQRRDEIVIGIPKLLNMFFYTPFFSTYFRTLGVKDVVFSPFTNDKLWGDGNKWGAIDPCFPAKVAPAHIWNLLNRKGVTHICFPIITHLESTVKKTLGNTACVIQMGTPEVVQAVFSRDRDLFKERNIAFCDPAINMDKPLEYLGILYEYFKDILEITEDENAWAVAQAEKAQAAFLEEQRTMFSEVMTTLIDKNRVGLLLIGHPYHHDPGLNHEIPVEFQKRGYPVFTIESLPKDHAFLSALFSKSELAEELHLGVEDVWMRNFNRNTNHKVWAAKIASRHPNLAVIDLSSFKCGHDAPTYSYVDQILDASSTPHFTFHDIDQNRPGATFKIRIDTIVYFLKQYEKELSARVAQGEK